MTFAGSSAGRCMRLMRAGVAGGLCLLLAGQPLVAAVATKKTPVAKEIQGDERVLHALNRFTFGPRPGDVAAVRAMGLQEWFERQLNPSSIDDTALENRLGMFPAMKLQQAELMRRYPSPVVLRQMMQTNAALPSDPVEHAIYADQIALYKLVQAKQAAAQADASQKMAGDGADSARQTALPGDGVDPAMPAMSAHEEQFYKGLDAVRIINLPPDQRVQRILAMPPEELIAFRQSLSAGEQAAAGAGLSAEQKEIVASLAGSPRMIGGELLQSRMIRDIFSERQLEAVMTDFWLNHFNIYVKKNQNEPYLLPAYERDVIRANALGKFEDLLVATAKSPAMLMYLDNWQSIGPESQAAVRVTKLQEAMPDAKVVKALPQGLNENYARELMELHTLGVNGGYTQTDVTQVAKVFTGWTIEQPYRGAEYKFEARRHEPEAKTVLGASIPEGGEAEGLQVLHMLASSPATARFISNKLAVRFVSDTPPPALVDRMAKGFLASDGDIKTVLRTMFESPEFWSPEAYRAKVKTPLEFVVSAVRASDAGVNNAQPLVGALDKLGMPLYGMQTPNGYSWVAEPWVSTSALVSRMNFALVLSSNRLMGVRTDWTRMFGRDGSTVVPASITESDDDPLVKAKEMQLETFLMGQPVSEKTRASVLDQLRSTAAQQEAEKSFGIRPREIEPMAAILNAGAPVEPGPPLDRQAAVMAGLLLGSPEFQRR
ncbi:uncharacterized protein (DUF1800 family) [Edaphobacter aggregans]|uniref:Uncharacterized protein (DUF1800 family) n=1 Tax=Edaphobacter aggregans TaxID=570835 RepID=A0A428MCC8_9BACT|nr:DUF1800 domain-containing protein [Edaphobacter aggregans]RSL14551.1 uncharacterized protein (DUF1800 family) [Edaphobacter aggregans]